MKRLLALGAFQVLAILSWASYQEYVWATAPTFRIPLRTRDPFDLLWGRYVFLNPADAAIGPASDSLSQADVEGFLGSAKAFAGKIQVGFCPKDDLYRVCALARPGENPVGPARFWSTADASFARTQKGWELRLDLGLRRFFIPNRLQLPARENQEGWSLEVCHRPGQTPLPRHLFFKGTPIGLR